MIEGRDHTSGSSVIMVGPPSARREESMEITYDPLAHAYWQFLYKAEGLRIAFRTSADGAVWVERHSVTALVPLDALAVRLEAGTYSGGQPGIETATFDDFERCAP